MIEEPVIDMLRHADLRPYCAGRPSQVVQFPWLGCGARFVELSFALAPVRHDQGFSFLTLAGGGEHVVARPRYLADCLEGEIAQRDDMRAPIFGDRRRQGDYSLIVAEPIPAKRANLTATLAGKDEQ